ncbi:ZN391 protein, partial [Mionectes macconnelli]|nr:ZN391 protein [Mionectes macconnelli]
DKPYKCLDCGKSFTRSSNRNAHQRLHSGERPQLCGQCGRGFGHGSELAKHQRLHGGQRPLAGGKCGQGFGWSSELALQQRARGGESCGESCGECGKSPRRGSDLSGHLRTRRGERPFACPDCGKGFSYSSAFLKHRRGHGAGGGGEKPPFFPCAGCGESFAEGSALLRHQRSH